MSQKSYRPEEIIAKLREAEVLLGQGKKVPEVVKMIGISGLTNTIRASWSWCPAQGGEVQVTTSARRITAETGLLGVIGYPVGHSLSPLMHNAALRAHGLDLVYVAFNVKPSDLEAVIGGARGLGVRGLNIAVPHKEAIIALMDGLEDDLAGRVGAGEHGGQRSR